MIFNAPVFLMVFLPLSALLFFHPALRPWRLPVIVALSLFFYDTSAGGRQVALLVGCIGWVYLISGADRAVGSKGRLGLAILLPLAVLLYFKYARFLLDSVGLAGLMPVGKGEIPAGISFYVFHLASFAFDRYRGIIPSMPSPAQFACYVSFFPQLVAGPITRYGQVGESIRALVHYRPQAETIWSGVAIFSTGFAVKVLLADPLMAHLEPLLSQPDKLDRVASAYLILAYSFRIYFDFYGYSMMAMGLGQAFGVALPRNFDRPYLSLNPKDFWRRWHMTLSFWIRDYLYLPLGGNRHHVRNILIVFAVCGLWHGAGWNFIVWGLYHGVLVLVYSASAVWWDRLPRLLACGLTFVLVSCGWPLFALDVPSFLGVLGNLVAGQQSASPAVSVVGWGWLVAAAVVTFAVDTDRLADVTRPGTGTRVLIRQIGLGLAAAMAVGMMEGSRSFIYFQF